MTAINGIARHRRPEDMPDWGFHVEERVSWPVAERSAELVGLVLAGRLDQTVPADECDALALLVLSQAYGPEFAVTLAVERWLALHIDADPDLRGGFLSGAEYTLDRVDRVSAVCPVTPIFDRVPPNLDGREFVSSKVDRTGQRLCADPEHRTRPAPPADWSARGSPLPYSDLAPPPVLKPWLETDLPKSAGEARAAIPSRRGRPGSPTGRGRAGESGGGRPAR
ncbi:hypothetical protein P3T27_008193 [Kitasatospora sp. MAA19]|nr:hypothetical protein [Kitasatospora sp. MAA19]